VVVDLIKESNPNCYLVTGRPRTPRDQGSVENANKMVQQVLKSISPENRLRSKEVNWTKLLQQVMSVVTVILAFERIASQATKRYLDRNIINNSNVICLNCANVNQYSRD
jgi:hypothetical protein